jgi:hypothetical protein
VTDAAIISSTDTDVSDATPHGLPVQRNQPVHVKVGHGAAISASSATHQVVVHLIQPSAQPVIATPRGPAHR